MEAVCLCRPSPIYSTNPLFVLVLVGLSSLSCSETGSNVVLAFGDVDRTRQAKLSHL